jgi:hypothetical protein
MTKKGLTSLLVATLLLLAVSSLAVLVLPSSTAQNQTTTSSVACTKTITVTLTAGLPPPPLAVPLPGSCYAFVTVSSSISPTSTAAYVSCATYTCNNAVGTYCSCLNNGMCSGAPPCPPLISSTTMTTLSGRLSYDGTTYSLTVGPSITPGCCQYPTCVVAQYLMTYQLDFSQVSVKPTLSDNKRLVTVVGTAVNNNLEPFIVSLWSYYTPPLCPIQTGQSTSYTAPTSPSTLACPTGYAPVWSQGNWGCQILPPLQGNQGQPSNPIIKALLDLWNGLRCFLLRYCP